MSAAFPGLGGKFSPLPGASDVEKCSTSTTRPISRPVLRPPLPTTQMSESPLRSALLDAMHRILSPLVRVLLAHEITLPVVVELLKRVYVDVADRDFRLDDKPSTDSRISLLTGVHRKDVKRLRELPAVNAELPPKVSLSAQVFARWITDPRWRDGAGQPRALARLARHGGEASFEALVASVSQDIRPRSLLDEWLRQGIASLDADDAVTLAADAFVPRKGQEEKLAYFAHNLGDHAAAAADNVLGAAQPWFERSVHHHGMSAAEVEQLRAQASEIGMQMLTRLHASAEAAHAERPADRPGERRFTCGIYFYSADDRAEEDAE